MPINIPNNLPAYTVLNKENIFVMPNQTAERQDIRPLKIAIINLMPKKIETETQILRLLSNTPLQVDIELIQMASHVTKTTSIEHLTKFYKVFDDVKDQRFDGLIITGAPVEQLPFEEVDYWQELCGIMEWSKRNVYSVMHICWGAQAGLYYHYGVPKYPLSSKMFGVFPQTTLEAKLPIFRGFDDVFQMPHSRHTELRREDILANPDLHLIAEGEESGVSIIMARGGREFFITGHMEYAPDTLDREYQRDKDVRTDVSMPRNYYRNNNPANGPVVTWRAHANLFYSNWINYYIYQETPYNIEDIK